MAKEPPDFEARRLIERYGPSFHVLRRVLDGLLVVSLIAVLVGATRWPIAVGFSQEGPGDDVNADPHAVVYPYHDGQWYLFVFQGSKPGFNFPIPGVSVQLGQWVRVIVEVAPETRTYQATIEDPTSGEILGQRHETLEAVDPAKARYDAVAFYDGEYEVSAGSLGGVAAIDNVVYTASLSRP